jgi:hypothetical protein
LLLYKNNRLYEGEWENNLRHGKGFEIFETGSFYNGLYVNGKPEGIYILNYKSNKQKGLEHLNGVMAKFMKASG